MREEFRLTLTLVVICILSAVALSLAYEKTNLIIQENKDKQLKDALKDVLPSAESFEEIKLSSDGIKMVFKGLDKGKVIGLVLLTEKAGFQSFIKTLIGIDLSTKEITNVKILEHLETPGLGSRIEENIFLTQFQKQPLTGQKIDAITGATISSKAVIDSVKESTNEILRLIEENRLQGIKFIEKEKWEMYNNS